MLKKITATLLGMGAAMLATAGWALDGGDVLVRFGPAGVFPNDHATDLNNLGPAFGIYDAKPSVDRAWSAGLTLVYMATENIGIELLAAWPFKHKISGDGALGGVTLGDTKQLPPTLLAQYYFLPKGPVRPYIGAGINYTIFFDTNGNAPIDNLDLTNSWGFAGEVGVDVDLNKNWFVNVSGWYMDIDTRAKAEVAGVTTKSHVDIDPWVFMFGVGTRF
ncbi:MAG: OmpW family outer membrane protein [Candidatus Competibacteraceae bacterium]